jgi:hypothetical protein
LSVRVFEGAVSPRAGFQIIPVSMLRFVITHCTRRSRFGTEALLREGLLEVLYVSIAVSWLDGRRSGAAAVRCRWWPWCLLSRASLEVVIHV